MKFLGDITKLHGNSVPIVDVVTGGSPCQDLSIAGKRLGLSGNQSSLFLEQIRLISEMRSHDMSMNNTTGISVCPRFMVWENVLGALSSNKGNDFYAVLSETVKIVDKSIQIPKPARDKAGTFKWTPSGCIMGDGWSVAWRVHDAQFWGVLQRRKRIALVADFGGQSAPEILFERKMYAVNSTVVHNSNDISAPINVLHKNSHNQSSCTCYGIDQQGGKGGASYTVDVSPTLASNSHGTPHAVCIVNDYKKTSVIVENHPNDSRIGINKDGIVQTLSGRMGTGGGNVPMVMEVQAIETHENDSRCELKDQINQSLTSCMEHDATNGKAIVRRLTPLEAERLQGFPTIRKVRFTEMTKDEYIAWNINERHIVVDTEYGKVFATRNSSGIKLDEPKELIGSVVNGYKFVSIHNCNTKMQCSVHRIVWIAKHGIIPDGYVIDHINNNKQDNRICNLQLLMAVENSTKTEEDDLYRIHGDSDSAKITDEVHDFIYYVYGNTDSSIRQLSEIFGISKSRVHQIIHDEAWTNIGEWIDSKGKKHKASDSLRYKAIGNSIALPFWQWMADRIYVYLHKSNPTMASLFSGIGGFELVFQCAGISPKWNSEIEEFPQAVTAKRFGL